MGLVIHKSERTENWFQIAQKLDDYALDVLTYDAYGLWSWAIRRGPYYPFSVGKCCEVTGFGKTKIQALLKELEEKGYLVILRKVASTTSAHIRKIGDPVYDYHFFELPNEQEEWLLSNFSIDCHGHIVLGKNQNRKLRIANPQRYEWLWNQLTGIF